MTDTDREAERRPRAFWSPFLIAVLSVVGLWGANWVLVRLLADWIPDRESAGQLGDMFGVSNALFSGLALAGIVTALILQNREMGFERTALMHQLRELYGKV
jgi:hypothetical protein